MNSKKGDSAWCSLFYFTTNPVLFLMQALQRFIASVTLPVLMLVTSSCAPTVDLESARTSEVSTVPLYGFSATPVWSDEFNYTGAPTPVKWSYDIGGGGWGNNELQYYTNGNNAYVSNGSLAITARRENAGGRSYTSSRLVSKFKGDFLYGRFESRIQLPQGRGTWPAFWMLPTDNFYGQWPRSGEIDIVEHVGFDPNRVHIATHTLTNNGTNNTQIANSRVVPTAMYAYHIYRVDWTPIWIRGFVDGVQLFELNNLKTGYAYWPFNKRFHMLLNIAVGGNWGGAQGVDNTIFPSVMLVDYVRVYRLTPVK